MGFREESEAARARIESLERALEGTQRALDAVRAELEVERASQVAPSVLAAQRSEIEALKAGLELKRRAGVEREPLPRARREPPSRTARIVIAFLIVALVGTVAGLRLAGNLGRLRAIATCVDQMRRSGTGDVCADERLESVQRPR